MIDGGEPKGEPVPYLDRNGKPVVVRKIRPASRSMKKRRALSSDEFFAQNDLRTPSNYRSL